MVQPIQYQIPGISPDPFAGVLQGLKIGGSLAEMDAMRAQRALQQQQLQQQIQQRQAAMEQQQRFQTGIQSALANPSRTWQDLEPLLAIAPNKDQADAVKTLMSNADARVLQNEKNFAANVLLAIESNPEVAKRLLTERMEAEQNPQTKQFYQTISSVIDVNPKQAGYLVELGGAQMYGKDWYEGVTNVRKTRQEAALAPEQLRKLAAEADKAVADAKSAQAAATTAAAREKANLDRANAEARKAEVEARVARAEEQLTGGFRATEQIRNAEFYRNASPKQQEALENVVKLGRSTTEIIMPGETTGQKELAQAAPTWASQMRDAANITGDVNRYRKLLPKAITGTFADQRAAVARAFGFGAENLAATREVVRGLGRFVLNGRGKLEGQGAISNFEQEVIAKAESGDISLSPAELSTLFDAVERDARLLYQQNRSLFDNTKEAYPTVKIFEVLSKSVPKLPEPVRVKVPTPPAPAPARPAAAAPAPAAPLGPPRRSVTGVVTPAESFAVTPQPSVTTMSVDEMVDRWRTK